MALKKHLGWWIGVLAKIAAIATMAVMFRVGMPFLCPNPPIALQISQNRFQNMGKTSISSIIGTYKSAVSKHANRLRFENGWQSLFHDHIIRNVAEYYRITNYILKKP